MDVGGATLAIAARQAGLIDESVIVAHPVLVGGHSLTRPPRPVRATRPCGYAWTLLAASAAQWSSG
jgi:riboflavin biosynthesis pyrimidine reductase